MTSSSSTPSTTRECCPRCYCTFEGKDKMCHTPSCDCHTQQTGSWEEQVKEIIGGIRMGDDDYRIYVLIRSLLIAERNKFMGEVENLGKKQNTLTGVYAAVYQGAINDVLSILKREGEELTNS